MSEHWTERHERHEAIARQELNELDLAVPDPIGRGPFLAVTHALLALVAVQVGSLIEQRKLRRALEKCCGGHHSNRTVALNLSGRLVSKQGSQPMPAGPFNPTDTQDVQLQIAPVDAAGSPTTGPFSWTADPSLGNLQPSADGLSCLLVTAAGAISGNVTVTDSVSGLSDTASVSRTGSGGGGATVNLSLSGQTVEKGAIGAGLRPFANTAARPGFAGANSVNAHGQLVNASGQIIATAYPLDPSKFVNALGQLIDHNGTVIRQKA